MADAARLAEATSEEQRLTSEDFNEEVDRNQYTPYGSGKKADADSWKPWTGSKS